MLGNHARRIVRWSRRGLRLTAYGLLLTAYGIVTVSPAWAKLGKQFIKPADTLAVPQRYRLPEETSVAHYLNPPLDKLSRGAANVLTSAFEWPVTVYETRRQHGWIRALTVGPIVGTGRAVTRLGSGVVDLLTFPFPAPHRALWVKHASLFYDPTARATWVLQEASTAQRELGVVPPPERTP